MFYLLLLVIGGLMLIYYYYYIPNNQAEFNTRGTRVLQTMVDNFLSRSQDFDSIIPRRDNLNNDTATISAFLHKNRGYETLYHNTHYDVQENWADEQESPYIKSEGEWKIVYPVKKMNWKVSLPMQDFGEKLFNARRDIFHTYMLLTPASALWYAPRKEVWNIIYREDDVTTSSQLNLDTLPSLLRNSDQSAIIDVRISDNPEKLFLHSFDFHGNRVVIGGLIDRKEYQQYIKHTPFSFISMTVILITLLIVMLPFLKIFFLSPHENITWADVLSTILSIFMGTAALLIILLYIYTSSVSKQAFHIRMKDVAGKIGSDMETQIGLASAQLDTLRNRYGQLSDAERQALSYTPSGSAVKSRLDSDMLPRIYPGLSRLFWIDDQGKTLAKWNPFIITPPMTNVRNYDFFKLLNGGEGPRPGLVVYPGKSNVTGDFLVYIAKPIKDSVISFNAIDRKHTEELATGIVMSASMHCTLPPVLPPGFGFCIVDDKGRVLIHSDSRRNISENLVQETGSDRQLINDIRLRNNGLVPDVHLYGEIQDIYMRPIKDQPLFVAVFFDKRMVTNSITRILHFTILSVLYIFLALALCILFSTFTFSKPSRLRFKLNSIEWIRLSDDNRYSYRFTMWFYGALFASHISTLAIIRHYDTDMRTFYYLSMLLPLYALWGFIVSRKHLFTVEKKDGKNASLFRSLREIFFTSPTILLIVALFNILLVWQNQKVGPNNVLVLLGVQFIYLVEMSIIYWLESTCDRSPQKKKRTWWWQKKTKAIVMKDKPTDANKLLETAKKNIRINYMGSLLCSVLIVSVIPTIGIFAYAFYSEKIQYKKAKALHVAATYAQKRLPLKAEWQEKYLPGIAPAFATYIDTTTRKSGIYLSDSDEVRLQTPDDHPSVAAVGVDGPYRFLEDNLYQFTSSTLGQQTISDRANDSDSSWIFSVGSRTVAISYKYGTDTAPVFVRSRFLNPVDSFRQKGVFVPDGVLLILAVLTFLYIGSRLIYANMSRLFFLHFTSAGKVDESYLNQLFNTGKANKNHVSGPKDKQGYSKELFEEEKTATNKLGLTQEEYILKSSHYFEPFYDMIWKELSPAEQYMLYDLALDGYTNYKNGEILYRLINKGIVICSNYQLSFFSLSFRNYILAKKDTKEMQDLLANYSTGGVWQSIRVPAFMLMGALLVFVVFTQGEVAHDLTALVTSAVALVPILLQLLGKSSKSDA